MSEGEQVIREYHAIKLHGFFKSFDGKLALTNKRAITYGKEKVILGEHDEINDIENERIEGTKLISGFSVSWKSLIVGILIVLFGIIASSEVNTGVGILIFIIGIIIIILSFRREFGIEIKSFCGNNVTLHGSGLMIDKVRGPDADVLMKGLMTMILDIKLRGDKILESLKCPNPNCDYMKSFDEKTPKHCPECGKEWKE